jgi:hypothetical protein
VALLIGHVEHANRPRAHDAAGEGRLGDHDQHIERIAVLGHGVLDEPVVARVVHARIERPIEHEPMPHVVVLVLVAAA